MTPKAKPEVHIRCEGATLADINDLKPMQGDAKTLSTENYAKLRSLIETQGFSFPVWVWKHNRQMHILDGHQRVATLKKMRQEGWDVPRIPVDIVHASTLKEAQEKLLAAMAQFGHVNRQGLYEFLSTNEIDFSYLKANIDLPNLNLDSFNAEYFDGEWQSDIEAKEKVDDVEPNLDGIISTIEIECRQEDKDAVTEAVRKACSVFPYVKVI